MQRLLRWLIWIGGGLLALILLAVIAVFVISELRLRQTYDIEAAPVPIPTDAASIEHGRHLAMSWAGCTACHGHRLEGRVILDESFARITAPNLTSGDGGIADFYDNEDWVRAIRHGVGPDGRGLIVMPSTFYRLSDDEVGAIIAYVQGVPPVDKVVPSTEMRPMARMGIAMGQLQSTAQLIDHDAARSPVPPPGPTAAYGEHIARGICVICHGTNFAGGVMPAGAESPPAPFPEDEAPRNLTPSGNLATWTEQDFFTTLRTRVTPTGEVLGEDAMPWPIFARLTEDELRALWLFLQTLPPAQPEAG